MEHHIHLDILSDGHKTVVAEAFMYTTYGDRIAATASSSCNPLDHFDYNVGASLAVGRAVRALGRQILAEGHEAVHHNDRARQKQLEAAEKAYKERKKRGKKYAKNAKVKKNVNVTTVPEHLVKLAKTKSKK